MVKFVLGPEGSGKTKWLIDGANKDKAEGHGNIAFIDTDDSHIFTLDHTVRLINARDFDISNSKELYGFLCGIISRDYDIEKIYIDGIYDIINFNLDTFLVLVERLNKISKEFNVEFLMGMNKTLEEMPEEFRENSVELEV
ncbi:hypothetical protein [Microaceticoccus formicicus]|uniref:hypothetical protein n=1 Tax=Microaceticoccus formicicus TaxID=3118105 RepID=UPI003CD00802|nr:hypothetical protein VZL98_05910 [Peptoniphilaceae bacterium AMB_02]